VTGESIMEEILGDVSVVRITMNECCDVVPRPVANSTAEFADASVVRIAINDSCDVVPPPVANSLAELALSPVASGVCGAVLQLDLKRLADIGITYSAAHAVAKRREYRAICRRFIGNLEPSGITGAEATRRMAAITSALPGEGKTYTGFNLARTIADLNESAVLLIDCDLSTRSISVGCGAAELRGVADFLRGDVSDLESLICRTNIPRLTILPSGDAKGEAHALMSASRLQRLTAGLAANRDGAIVIFDCPPVLASDDAVQLASNVHRVLFVVGAAKTPAESVRSAIDRLGTAIKPLLLLNGWAPKHLDRDYGSSGWSQT
jgi:protein-tyrosine kinase